MELEVIATLSFPGQTEDFLTEIRREVALPFFPRQKSQQCSQVWLFIAKSAKLQLSLTTEFRRHGQLNLNFLVAKLPKAKLLHLRPFGKFP